MADITPDAVNTARKSGYSDDEIVSFLSQKNPDQFKAASDAGYSSTEILDHLGTTKDKSYAGAVQQGVSDVVSGVGKTIKDYISPDKGAAVESVGAKAAPKNYSSATEEFMNRGAPWYDKNFSAAPRALVENAPALATDVLAGLAARKLAGGKAAAAAVGSGLSYLLRTRGEAAESRARNVTGDENAQPSTEDKIVSAAAGIPEAALAAVGANRFTSPTKIASTGVRGAVDSAKKLATTAAVEGSVGAAQDTIGQVADTAGTPGGLKVDPGQVFGSTLLSAGTGAGMGAVHAAADLNSARRFRGFDGEAAQRVANRIQSNSDGDLSNVKTARNAVGAAETDIKSDLSNAFSVDPAAKASIDASDNARRALARFNAGEQVTDADLGHIESASSGTRAGNTVSSLIGEMRALRKLQDMGSYNDDSFKGGVSNQMEKGVRAIYNPVGALTGAGLAAAGLSQPALAAGMLSSAPAAVAGSLGAYALARALDKATGYRSPAKTFVDKFGGTQAATPAIAAPQQPQRPGPTGPAIAQAPTFNGKQIEPPFGTARIATPADLSKRDNRLTKAVDTALGRGVDQQNREDARQDASVENGADMIGRGALYQVRAERRMQAMKDRADAVAERQAQREQVADATGLVQSRNANLKVQTQDATQVAQAKRANDALQRRGDIEQTRDARELMASRQSPNSLDKVQATDARELMAARRAHEKLQAKQDAADNEAAQAKAAVGNDNAVSPDTMKQAQKLIKSLSVVQKIKDRVDKSQAQLEKKQASIDKANERSQAKAERDAVKEAKAMAKATKAAAAAPAAAPKPKANGKATNGDATPKPSKLDDYPEAPWAYETPHVAAKMALDYAKAQGTDISNPEGYKRGAAARINSIVDTFADVSKDVPKSDLHSLEIAQNKMLAVRSETDARNLRELLKDAMPKSASAIDKHVTDEWIKNTWKPKRSSLH